MRQSTPFRTMLRVGLQAGGLGAVVVLVGMALSESAWPQEPNRGAKSDAGPNVEQPEPRSRGLACNTQRAVHKMLTEQFGETVQAIGIVNPKAQMHIYVSAEGSWTSLIVTAEGMSCIVAAGKHFTLRKAPPPGEGA